MEDFVSEIPIFKLLGAPTLVESTAQYSDVSDPDVQLVCKYLNAYDIGGAKGIDKLYKEGAVPMQCVVMNCDHSDYQYQILHCRQEASSKV